ncbi:MAG: hypothetical protein LBR16_06700 [Treponema sp.]|nr:hypothetical protein [Treponema sp.]
MMTKSVRWIALFAALTAIVGCELNLNTGGDTENGTVKAGVDYHDYANDYTQIHLTPGTYNFFPVIKKYDFRHNNVITIKPTFSQSHENEAVRGQSWFKSVNIKETGTTIINANDFVDTAQTFSTGSAYLVIVNASGNGLSLIKGDTRVNVETDFTVLSDAETATLAVDVGKVGNTYNSTVNVGSYKIGWPGYEKALSDAGQLIDSTGASVSTDMLNLELDYVYQITVLKSGKFQWDGKQNTDNGRGGKLSLDDLEEPE